MHILEELNLKTSSDFAAIAFVVPISHHICWGEAVGSLNGKYKGMRKKYGSGLIGAVARHGRMMVIDDRLPKASQKRLESPIMLAEKLFAAIAAPIFLDNEIRGVLLVGSRSNRIYSQEEIELIADKTKDVELLLGFENN